MVEGPPRRAFATRPYFYPHFVGWWTRGEPVKSILFGIWLGCGVLPTRTFRCAKCGYLESYAREEFAARAMRFSLKSLLIVFTIVAVVMGILVWAIR
jgi:hypothetical protein